jgi:hypothetical protein
VSDTDRAVKVAWEYLAHRPGVRSRLTDQVDTGMRAQALEQTRSTAVISERDDEEGDRGPRITDTTGEAAIRVDAARRLLVELDRAERTLTTEAHRLYGPPIGTFADLAAILDVLARCCPAQLRRSASVFDRALAETYSRHRPDPGKSADGEAGCDSCARLKVKGVPWWSPRSYNRGRSTDFAGRLRVAVHLCKSCRDFICRDPDAEVYHLPNVDQLTEKRETGKWPAKDNPVHRYSAA